MSPLELDRRGRVEPTRSVRLIKWGVPLTCCPLALLPDLLVFVLPMKAANAAQTNLRGQPRSSCSPEMVLSARPRLPSTAGPGRSPRPPSRPRSGPSSRRRTIVGHRARFKQGLEDCFVRSCTDLAPNGEQDGWVCWPSSWAGRMTPPEPEKAAAHRAGPRGVASCA